MGGFESLIYLLNLNQSFIYLKVAFWLFAYLAFAIILLYDFHYKVPGSLLKAQKLHDSVRYKFTGRVKIVLSAISGRLAHLKQWKVAQSWLNYLLLPGFIFWGTVSLFYVNFGVYKIQQIIAVFSSLALVLHFWYLKEVFYRKKEKVDSDVFVALSMVKIYASAVLFASSMAMLRRFCMSGEFFMLETGAFTFLLIYQALFQHKMVTLKNTAINLGLSAIMAVVGYFVYFYWGYNYFTAAVFLSACYNLLWGIFHYYLDRVLTLKAFMEILLISILIAGMVISVTNFKARVLDACI